MTMCCIRNVVFVLCVLNVICCSGQNDFTGYLQPQVSLNYRVAPRYDHNFSVTNRNYFYQANSVDLAVRQIDLAHFSKYKIRDNQSLGLGVQYRFRSTFETDKNNELRLTQQYNFTKKPYVLRFGHRFRSEQRIFEGFTVHRFRYRLALDRPFQGETLDLGEAYFILGFESLLSVARSQKPQADQRLSAQIGWLLNKSTKLQAGFEYRWEDYTQEVQQVLFLLTGLVFSL